MPDRDRRCHVDAADIVRSECSNDRGLERVHNGASPDARIGGVIVAGLALWRKAGFITTVVVAVGTTAALRAVF